MLNNLTSFALVQKVADFYHLPGLREKMGLLRDARERAENGEDEDESGAVGDVRSGWGRIGEPVPRAGVSSFLRPSSTSARRYDDVYEGGNGRHSLEFPPAPILPRRSLAAASAYPAPLSASFPSMPSSPPSTSGNTYAYSDVTFDSQPAHQHGGNTQDTFASGSLTRKRARDGEDDGDQSTRRVSPGPVAPAKSPSRLFFRSRHVADFECLSLPMTDSCEPFRKEKGA
jgi:chromosome transmission fidelity protein 4